MYQQRSVATVVVLSIVTCGIYFFYWVYVTMRDVNGYLGITDMDPGVELLICILCAPYLLYWYYKYALRITEVNIKTGFSGNDDGVVCLVLAIFGLSIVSTAIMQGNLNKAWAAEQNSSI